MLLVVPLSLCYQMEYSLHNNTYELMYHFIQPGETKEAISLANGYGNLAMHGLFTAIHITRNWLYACMLVQIFMLFALCIQNKRILFCLQAIVTSVCINSWHTFDYILGFHWTIEIAAIQLWLIVFTVSKSNPRIIALLLITSIYITTSSLYSYYNAVNKASWLLLRQYE